GQGGPGGGGGGGGFGGGGAPPRFGVIDLAAGTTRTREGAAPTMSGDGRSLAYVARAGAESQLMLGAPLADGMSVVKTTGRLDAPALSPDGSRVAYQLMNRDDWEIYVVNRDGTNERRLTKDV